MAVNERIRREVELLPWPEVIGDDECPSASEQLLERAGEVAIENERLLKLSADSAEVAEGWERRARESEGRAERLAGEVIFWHRQATAYRRLAIVAGVVIVVAGAWRLLG